MCTWVVLAWLVRVGEDLSAALMHTLLSHVDEIGFCLNQIAV